MKRYFAVLSPFAFALALPACYGQDVTTASLTWQVSGNRDLQTQKESAYTAVFSTTPTTVTWSQRNGQRVSTYNIVSTEGTWTDLREPGSITLRLARDERRMTMKLSRDENGLTITLEILKEGSPPFRQRFQVSTASLTP